MRTFTVLLFYTAPPHALQLSSAPAPAPWSMLTQVQALTQRVLATACPRYSALVGFEVGRGTVSPKKSSTDVADFLLSDTASRSLCSSCASNMDFSISSYFPRMMTPASTVAPTAAKAIDMPAMKTSPKTSSAASSKDVGGNAVAALVTAAIAAVGDSASKARGSGGVRGAITDRAGAKEVGVSWSAAPGAASSQKDATRSFCA